MFASAPFYRRKKEIYVEELEWMGTFLTTIYFHYA